MVALWWPLPTLLVIFFSGLWGGEYSKLDSTHSEWLYLLWWGIPGYGAFSLWMTRAVKGRDEQQALRMVWLAPLKFIPFYAVPWVIYGLSRAFAEQSDGFFMTFGWIFVLPYLLIAGYVCAGLTVALYRTFYS